MGRKSISAEERSKMIRKHKSLERFVELLNGLANGKSESR